MTNVNTTQRVAPMSVPADYAALGVVTGYNPPEPERLRFFIMGPSGDGKTTFVAGIPDTLILDFEDGAWGVPNPRAHRIVCKTPEQFLKVHAKLLMDAKAGRLPYKRICLDTIDQFVETMNPEIGKAYDCTDMTQYGGKGAGWSILKNKCWDYISSLEQAGYSWIILGHMTEKTIVVGNKDKTVVRPVLYDSFAKHISRNSDYFVTIYSKSQSVPQYKQVKLPNGNIQRIETGSIERPVYVMKASSVGALLGTNQNKQRGVPTMPQEIDLPDIMEGTYGWDTFCDSYNKAVGEVRTATELRSTEPKVASTVGA